LHHDHLHHHHQAGGAHGHWDLSYNYKVQLRYQIE
jgi:hypothetical protein